MEYRRIHLRASPGSAGQEDGSAEATGSEAGAGTTVSAPGAGGPEPGPAGQNEKAPA